MRDQNLPGGRTALRPAALQLSIVEGQQEHLSIDVKEIGYDKSFGTVFQLHRIPGISIGFY